MRVRGSIAAAVVFGCLMFAQPAGAADNAIVRENARAGDRSWLAPYATARAVEGYASEISVFPGEALHLHVSTAPAEWYRIRVLRLGWYGGAGARLISCLCAALEHGQQRPVPAGDRTTDEVQAIWPVTDTVLVPQDATSGYYEAQIVLGSGPQAGAVQNVPFVVRSRDTGASRVLVQVPATT